MLQRVVQLETDSPPGTRAHRPGPHPRTQAAFYIDTARALSNINKDTEVLRMLLNAERLAPQRVRLSPLVTETVRHLLEKSRRGTGWTELRALCEHVGVSP